MSDDNNERIARDIESLVELFNQSDWDEMHLKTDELEVFLSNDPRATSPSAVQVTSSAAPAAGAETAASASPSPTAAPDTTSAADVDVPAGMVTVVAPNLGTFYRAPKPGAPPYVEVGQDVDEHTDVCLIEVMKLFTPVKAGLAGKVHAVCVSDGTMVEHGQPLIIIDPA